ncbi:hypothetical protein DFR70_111231 [Nocardia tenerifensis]|uniref:Uncharacterized protein n=1 Tax=Nocardia tenerifensis TaxID=228006 RepID=A0A318JV83_9NOCA|nr:hypothetical protein [Nocardia tenerifensis]PXX59844.1 hypothetical protein DFR70_111231 [Nocardia tenerifensis]
MGYEWNDRLEAEYTRYVDGKWFKGLNARDRKGYLKAREQWKRSRDKGNRFRDGMALLRGQTPERGYEKEVRLETSLGTRVSDVANVSLSKSSEYKAGGSEKNKTLKQLEKDERYLREVPGAMVDWTIVQGARHDKEVQDRIKVLQEKYRGQFVVHEISREQLRLALTVGKHLDKQRRAKEKEARARDREEKQRQRERSTKEKQDRERIQAAERAASMQAAREFPTYEQLMQREPVEPPSKSPEKTPPAPETERDRVAREAAESAIREVQKQLGYNPLSPEKTPEKDTPEREVAEQKRQNELRIQREVREAQLSRLPPHVAKLVALGQAHGPERAVETPPGHAPSVQGHGRDAQGRDRGQTRDR